jgi:hypothetical protein
VLSSEWNTLDRRWLFFVQKTHSQALLFAGLPRQGPQPAGLWGVHEHDPGDWGCVNCSQVRPCQGPPPAFFYPRPFRFVLFDALFCSTSDPALGPWPSFGLASRPAVW